MSLEKLRGLVSCAHCTWSQSERAGLACTLPVEVFGQVVSIQTGQARRLGEFCGPSGVYFEREPGADDA